jgi:anaerobic ribonucleoside-triphosphate reductase activating protein
MEVLKHDERGIGELVDRLEAVDGSFVPSMGGTIRLWVGSANQRFHYLTGRYTAAIEEPDAGAGLRTVEVRIGTDGRWSANGWPAFERGIR